MKTASTKSMKKAAAGAVFGGALLAAGGFGLAHAAPPSSPSPSGGSGKVNVTVTANGQQVGVLQGVPLASAEALAAAACPNAGINVQALQALDTNNAPVPGNCTGADNALSFAFAQSGPGQNPTSTPTSTTPTSSSGAKTTTTTTTTTTTPSH